MNNQSQAPTISQCLSCLSTSVVATPLELNLSSLFSEGNFLLKDAPTFEVFCGHPTNHNLSIYFRFSDFFLLLNRLPLSKKNSKRVLMMVLPPQKWTRNREMVGNWPMSSTFPVVQFNPNLLLGQARTVVNNLSQVPTLSQLLFHFGGSNSLRTLPEFSFF